MSEKTAIDDVLKMLVERNGYNIESVRIDGASLRYILNELAAAREKVTELQARSTLDVHTRRAADAAQRFLDSHGPVLWETDAGNALGLAVNDLREYRKKMVKP